LRVRGVIAEVVLVDSFSPGEGTRVNKGFAADLSMIGADVEGLAFRSKGVDVDAAVFPAP